MLLFLLLFNHQVVPDSLQLDELHLGILNLWVSCFRLEIKTSHYIATKWNLVLLAFELV